MQRGRRIRKWIVPITIIGCIAWFAWEMLGLHVTEPRGFIDASEAKSIADIEIPTEAKNIRAASARQWIYCERYVRFEAPVDVCLRFAAKIAPGSTTRPVEADDLASRKFPVRKGVFEDLSWFDLNQAQDVVSTGTGGSWEPRVWIDRRRGVVYYLITD